MGTYKITPTAAASGVLSYRDSHGTYHSNAPDLSVLSDIVTGIPGGVGYNIVIGSPGASSGSVSCIANDIYLDGSSSITDINDLPVGFNITSAVYTPGISAPLSTNTTQSNVGGQTASPAAAITYDSNLISLNDVLATFFGIAWTINDANNGEIDVSSQLITGNYDIINSTWILENLTHPNASNIFNPGDIGKISSTDNSYDFTTINEIHITKINDDGTTSDTVIPSSDFTIWITVEIEFTVPSDTPISSPTNPSPVSIAGTQFSGTAFLASAPILSTNNSGVYKVVTNQTHDTLYLASDQSNTTTNVKIPDPYGKTGFIGG